MKFSLCGAGPRPAIDFLNLFRGKSAFVYPVPPAPLTAVLVPWFVSRGSVRVFERGWDADAASFQPAAIAGTWPQMESLLGTRIASPTHALIALARPTDPLLTSHQRDQLWHVFRVPIFEQIIGENGALLAAECEAHAGLHLESPTAGYSIEDVPCGCGRKTPRIAPAPPIEKVRAAAASMR